MPFAMIGCTRNPSADTKRRCRWTRDWCQSNQWNCPCLWGRYVIPPCCLIFKRWPSPILHQVRHPLWPAARAQASLIESMLEQEILTEKELEVYKRGRNTNSHTKAKNTDVTYRMSTGFWGCHGLSPYDRGAFSRLERADWLVHQQVEEGRKQWKISVVSSCRGDGSKKPIHQLVM